MRFEEVKAACEEAVKWAREKIVPNPNTRYKPGGSTGNLAYNALQYAWEGTTFHIWIDEEIAPYMVYTNEPWISPRWNGKKNPNEGWWDRLYEDISKRIAQNLNGTIQRRAA